MAAARESGRVTAKITPAVKTANTNNIIAAREYAAAFHSQRCSMVGVRRKFLKGQNDSKGDVPQRINKATLAM
jgi:hypothetical protein